MSREEKFQLVGWLMFIACAVLYLIASIESGSASSFWGSLIFLLACVVFMLPLIWRGG